MNPIDPDTHKARRAYRADRHGDKADLAPCPEGVPSAPSWLSSDGAAHWPDVAGALHAAGLLRQPDVHLVAMLCDALAEYVRLRDAAAAADAVVQGGKMARAHPLIAAVKESRADVLAIIRELGMSAKARRGLPVEPPKRGEIKPFGFV